MTFRWRTLLWALVGVVAGLVVVGVLVTAFVSAETLHKVRSTQIDGTPTGKRIEKLAEQVNSCVDPSGDCYRRGQRRQTGAITDINRITIYAAACADRPGDQSVDQIQSCVIRRLAANQSH